MHFTPADPDIRSCGVDDPKVQRSWWWSPGVQGATSLPGCWHSGTMGMVRRPCSLYVKSVQFKAVLCRSLDLIFALARFLEVENQNVGWLWINLHLDFIEIDCLKVLGIPIIKQQYNYLQGFWWFGIFLPYLPSVEGACWDDIDRGRLGESTGNIWREKHWCKHQRNHLKGGSFNAFSDSRNIHHWFLGELLFKSFQSIFNEQSMKMIVLSLVAILAASQAFKTLSQRRHWQFVICAKCRLQIGSSLSDIPRLWDDVW